MLFEQCVHILLHFKEQAVLLPHETGSTKNAGKQGMNAMRQCYNGLVLGKA
jgi:hypothetical protein